MPTWRRKEPLDELIVTILSQNTNDHNRDLAFGRLRERFRNWRSVLEAPEHEIAEAIRPAGLHTQKARRIKAILSWIDITFRELRLDPLGMLSDDEAIALLTSQTGIGVKTAAVLLAFAFDRDLCPVDTHVHRIARRLGWVPENASADQVFHRLRPQLPTGATVFHLNLLRFGREICTARKPKCGECPLGDECAWKGKGT